MGITDTGSRRRNTAATIRPQPDGAAQAAEAWRRWPPRDAAIGAAGRLGLRVPEALAQGGVQPHGIVVAPPSFNACACQPGLIPEDLRKLFHDTAARVYRL